MAYDKARDWLTNRTPDMAPGRNAWAITAAAEDQARYPRVLWLDTAGTVTGIPVASASDTTVSFAAPAGWFEMSFRRITACPAGTKGVD